MTTKRKDGRLQSSIYVTDYFTGEKKRVFVYGYNEKEIEAEKKRVKEETEKKLLHDRINPSFETFAQEVIDAKLADKSINEVTHESYERNINNHVIPKLPKDIKVTEIAVHHIKYILKEIKGARTKSYTYTVLNIIFQEAIFEHLITTNPLTFVRKPQYESQHAEVITPNMYRLIIQEVKGTQWEHLFKFAIATGCRREEICALHWSDIDFNAKSVKISTAIKKTKKKGEFEGTTKSQYSVRTLPLGDDVIQSLYAWKKQLRKLLLEHCLPFYETDFVFRNRTLDKSIPLGAVTRKMYELKKKLGLPDNVRMHSYRRTMATNLAVEDINPKKIQHTLGHASAAFSLDVYVKNSPEMIKGVAEANDAIAKKYTSAI